MHPVKVPSVCPRCGQDHDVMAGPPCQVISTDASPSDDFNLQYRYEQEMMRAIGRHERIQVDFEFAQATFVIAAIQLASRHPHFKHSPSLQLAEMWAQLLVARMKEYPAVQEVIRLGFDPKNDVLRGD